jgi:O-antigen ligase
LNRVVLILSVAILFVGGINVALPGYGWATPVQVSHGVFVDDALFILLFVLVAATGGLAVIRTGNTAFVGLIVGLATVGLVSAGVNGYSLLDFGEAMRLFLFAAYFVFLMRWAQLRGHAFLLRWYLLGIAAGGAINVYYAISQPQLVFLGLPVLSSRNGAGGLLAMGVCLSAWLWMVRQRRADAIVAVLAMVVGLSAVAISFSKTAMSIGACGMIAWICVAGSALTMRMTRRIAVAVVALLLVAGIITARSTYASEQMALVARSVEVKFASLDLSNPYSLGTRYMYFWAVLEVMTEHPLFGVSYTGFYEAYTRTTPYQSGLMVVEDTRFATSGMANPHNSFLYYASANGLPGLMLTVALFVTFLRALWRSRRGRGLAGAGITACVGLAYFIYGMTLPSMFNTEVLYLPAACAMCYVSAQWRGRARRTMFHPPHHQVAARA